MNSNKSIDGLSTRRAKTASTLSPSAKPTRSASKTSTKAVRRTASSPKAKTVKTVKTVKKSTRPVKQAPVVSDITPAGSPDYDPNTPTTAPEPIDTIVDSVSDTPKSSAEDFLSPTQVFNFDEQTGELQTSDKPIDPHPDKTDDDNNEDDDDDDIPELNPHAKKPKEKKAKKPVSKKRKIITSIILAIVLLLIAGVIWVVVWGNDIIAKITGGQGNIFDLFTFTEPTYERLKTDDKGRTNILAFGTSGYNMEGDEGNGTHDGAQLTDSIMAISINQDTGDMAMVSLPRDLKASPTCTATGKINEVYWCNNMNGDDEKAGAEALMQEVGNILGMDFQYYAHLNWGSLVQIVDTLGGITVTLDEDIEDYYYTGAVFEAGKPYTIDGGQALGLARARHGTAGGDFSRGASQQKILIGIKDKILEKSLSLTDLISLASTLGDNLRTNFNVEELKSIAHLASEFDFDSMRQISLLEPEPLMTTGTINGISYVLPSGGANYYTRIQNYVAKMLDNNPSVYEDATILVLNGTETPGLAASEQKSLEEDGFANISIGDAPAAEYTERYYLYNISDSKPGTKKVLEDRYGFEFKPASELPAGISTDYDFIVLIGS